MEYLKEEITQRLARVIFVGTFIFSVIASLASLLRTYELGWHSIHVVHGVLLFAYLILFATHKKIIGELKIHVPAIYLFLYGLSDFFFFGYTGVFYLGLASVYVTALLLTKEQGYAYLIANFIGLGIVGVGLYVQKIVPTATSKHWLLHGTALLWFFGLVFYSAWHFRSFLFGALSHASLNQKHFERLYNEAQNGNMALRAQISQVKKEHKNLKEKFRAIEEENAKIRHDNAKSRESDRLKTAFLDNLSHEIRTPVNGITGFFQLLNETEDENKLGYYKQIIEKSSGQLLNIVDDVLQMSQLETGQVEIIENRYSLKKLLQEVYDIFAPVAKDKNLDFSISGGTATQRNIVLDTFKVKQILKSFLTNAFKFTEKGSVEIGARVEKKQVIFWVKDTGIGISSEVQEKIFDYFHQDENHMASAVHGGMGIGLSISKGLVKIMGGKIWLSSEAGEGSTFGFSVPLNKV